MLTLTKRKWHSYITITHKGQNALLRAGNIEEGGAEEGGAEEDSAED
jgi:hypothetical protein